ncbi:MAG: HAMP domain-containing sensor histidine kinase [Caldimonas sp.]
MGRAQSLTQRVVWAVVATVALLIGLQTILAYVAMHAQEDELSDALLQHEVREVVSFIVEPGLAPTGVIHSAQDITAYLTRGPSGVEELPTNLRGLAPGLYRLFPAGRVLHVSVSDTDEGRLTIAIDATASEARVFQFGWTLLGLWAICVAITVWIARAVAVLAVGPMVSATRVIASWSPGGQIDAAGNRDEAAVLMETFNRFRDRMDDSVAREREFAANLEHEIRTPLTAIRTHAELLVVDAALAAPQAERARRIVDSVDEIIATAEEARLTVAGGRGAAERVLLRDCVQAACEALAHRAADKRLLIDNAVDAAQTVEVDRQALLTVVRNIVRNAIEHAAPAALHIASDGDTVCFDDDGPGIAAEALPHIFERYYQGRRNDEPGSPKSRHGLGLAIARRLCDMNGWTLRADSPRGDGGRGTRFTLRLGTVDESTIPQRKHNEIHPTSGIA